MRRQICWTERGEDGVAVGIRVTVSIGDIRWQFLRADQERWDYDSRPTEAQWDGLELRLRNRYQRGQIGLLKELEWVRKARQG
jgi:hypothetical protein